MDPKPTFERAAWSVRNWAAATDLSDALVYELIAAGRIQSTKLGRKRLILTPPREFVESPGDEAA